MFDALFGKSAAVFTEKLGAGSVDKIFIGNINYADQGAYEQYIVVIEGQVLLSHKPESSLMRAQDIKVMQAIAKDAQIPVIGYFPSNLTILIVDSSTTLEQAREFAGKKINDPDQAMREFRKQQVAKAVPEGALPGTLNAQTVDRNEGKHREQ